jgi:hypothetical protein
MGCMGWDTTVWVSGMFRSVRGGILPGELATRDGMVPRLFGGGIRQVSRFPLGCFAWVVRMLVVVAVVNSRRCDGHVIEAAGG